MKDTAPNMLEKQASFIICLYCDIYHKSYTEARKTLERSAFYRVLSSSDSSLIWDSPECNFKRFQNEIEYGNWKL